MYEIDTVAGISIQENMLDSTRMNEILERYLEEHMSVQEEDNG